MIIESGDHNCYKTIVNEEGKLETNGVAIEHQMHVNQEHGEFYSVIVSKTPTAAGDCFLYIKNTDDKDMLISSILLNCASAETIQIKLGDTGTAVSGSANTPVSRNAGSSLTADCTCEDGTDITGLSGGDVVEQLVIEAAKKSEKIIWRSGIIIPKNKTVTLYAVTGGIAIKGTLAISFHD